MKAHGSKGRRLLSLGMTILLAITLLPGQAISAAADMLSGGGADIRVSWESEKDRFAPEETAETVLRVEVSGEAAVRVESVTVRVALSSQEAAALSEDGNAVWSGEGEEPVLTFDIPIPDDGETWEENLTIRAPQEVELPFTFAVAEEDMAVTYVERAASPASVDAGGESVLPESAEKSQTEGAAADSSEELRTDGETEGAPAEELVIQKEGISLVFGEESQDEEPAYVLSLSAAPESLVPTERKLDDFTITARLELADTPQQGAASIVLTVALPQKLSFPEGTYAISETGGAVRWGEETLVSTGSETLSAGAAITAFHCKGNTLSVTITQEWEGTVGIPEGGPVYPITIHGALLEMEDDFRTGAITVSGQIAGGAESSASASVSIGEENAEVPQGIVVERTAELEQTLYWVDNHNEAGIRPGAEAFRETELYFSIDGGASWQQLTPANMAGLGLETMPVPDVEEGQSDVYTLTYPNLPAQVTVYDTQSDMGQVLESYTVTWNWGQQPPVDGYDAVEITEENAGQYPAAGESRGWFYVLETEVSVDMQVRWGTLGAAPGLRDLVMDGFALYVSGSGEAGGETSRTLRELEEAGALEIDTGDSPDPENPTVGTFTVSGCWKYDLDGTARTYYVDRTVQDSDTLEPAGELAEQLGEDFFLVSYDNSSAPNVGSVTDRAYDGGVVYVTLTGVTDYRAAKVWLDQEDSSGRPTGELHLWRYREGESYTTAAPVTDGTGTPYILELTGEDRQVIAFTDADGNDAQLEKYDQEGYRYIYVVREYLDATTAEGEAANGYQQIFGEVHADGSVTDTLLEGTGPRGDNRYVYNGGTLSNRLSDTVTATVEKTWNASAFQSLLGDVRVEFTLQARPAGVYDEDPEAGWTDAGVTTEKGGFTEEELTLWQSSVSVPAYGAQGERLEYRWVESAVYQGDSEENLLSEDGAYFTLTQDGRQVTYRVEAETTGGSGQTRISNSIADTLDYTAVKVWAGVDPPAGGVTFHLYRILSGSRLDGSDSPYLSFAWNGETITRMEPWPDGDDVTLPETAAVNPSDPDHGNRLTWTALVQGLPEFSEDGREYEYLLLEDTTGTPYFPTYETTRDENGNYQTVVTNGPGEEQRILVRKAWVDDSDSAHRGDVTIQVLERETNRQIAEVEVGGGVWSAQVGLGRFEEGDRAGAFRTPDDVYILETEVSPSQGEQDESYRVPLQPYLLSSGETPSYEPGEPSPEAVYQYETQYHRYEATYQEPFVLAGETVFTVTNRRLGNVNVTVEKVWADGTGELRQALWEAIEFLPDERRITPYLELDFVGEMPEEYHISKDGLQTGGPDTVDVGGAETPIHQENGEPATALQEIPLRTDEERQTFYFHDLPKYDLAGAVVYYEVREIWLTDTLAEVASLSNYFSEYLPDTYGGKEELLALLEGYRSAVTRNVYTASPEGDAGIVDDAQEITITNSLSDSKTIYWHKQWRDHYTQENNQRPDIYLDIWKVEHDADGLPVVSLYQADYRWEYDSADSALPEGEENRADPWNHWHAVITDVPKYDDFGYEILYFAVERTSVHAADFDYLPAEYGVGDPTSGGQEHLLSVGTVEEAADETYIGEYVIDVSDDPDSPEYALVEGGTFTNSLSDTVAIQGQKLWTSLPGGYPREDLPTVTFALDRSWTEGGETQTEENVASLTVSDWADIYQNGTYVFRIEYEGTNTMTVENGAVLVTGEAGQPLLPRYNEDGSLYTYTLRETSVTWPESSAGESAADWRAVFTSSVHSYVASNAYHGTRGTLAVKKLLRLDLPPDGSPAAFPAIRLELTRTYTRNSGETSDPERIAVQTWTAEQVESAYHAALEQGEGGPQPGSAGNPLVHSFLFENLELYAPNGSRYSYTVTEVRDGFLEGYETAWGAGDLEMQGSFQEGNTADGLYPLEVAEDEAVPIAATFQNVPAEDTVTLTGTKTWDDFGDFFGLRPSDENGDGQPDGLTLTLSRSADAQPGQNNAISRQAVSTEVYTVTWEMPANSDVWIYTIAGDGSTSELEAYAPNGMPWKYVVTETLEEELDSLYTPSPASGTVGEQSRAEGSQQGLTAAMRPLTNSLAAAVPYTKAWEDPRGNPVTGDYIGAVLTVDFALQVRETAGGTWQMAADYFAGALEDDAYALIFGDGALFTPRLTGRIGDTDTWSGAIQNLPTAIRKAGEAGPTHLEYRVVETSVTRNEESPQALTIQTDGTYMVEDAGFVTEASFQGTGNVTTNVLDVQDLTITKLWAGDNGNVYHTRPAAQNASLDWEVSFVIQRLEGNAWVNAQVYGDANPLGRDLVISLSGRDEQDTASVTISGLPAGTYRARELQPGWQRAEDGSIPAEYILSEDGSYYQETYGAAYADTEEGTRVTNTLNARTDLAAVKTWVPAPPEGAQVTLVLQYRNQDNRWVELSRVTLDGTVDAPSAAYEDAPWHVVWTGLPEYRPDGRGGEESSPSPTDYRVVELSGAGFVQLGDGEMDANGTYSFTNTPSTSLTVVKTWYGTDLENQTEVVAGLYRTTGTIGDASQEAVLDTGTQLQRTVALNAGNSWMGTFANLPAYDANGNLYTYYARELTVGGVDAAESGFDAEYQDGEGITHIVNYSGGGQEDYVRVVGTKTWEDRDDTGRSQILLHLFRTTTPQEAPSWERVPETEYILRWQGTETDQWRYSFENLPRYAEDGAPYSYRVEEESPEGYDGFAAPSASLLDSGLFLYNFTNVQQGGLTIRKQVTGGQGETDRAFAFTITLTGESSAGIQPAEVNGTYGDLTFQAGVASFALRHDQSVTAQGLPAGMGYQVTETAVEGYTTTSAGAEGTIPAGGTAEAVFTNYKPGSGGENTTQVTVRKVWRLDDGGTAADSVTVNLLRNGRVADSVTLSADNGWTHTWTGLSGSDTWTVEEADVPDGFAASVTRSGMNFTITNDDTGETGGGSEDPQPETPESPDPTDPGGPEEPGEPGQPTEQPEEPDTPRQPDQPDTPKTDDPTQDGLLALVCLASLLGMVLLAARSLRSRGRRP